MSVNYSKGYTASFKAYYVDPRSWGDIEPFDIVSGSINRNCDSLRNSASLTVRDYVGNIDNWVRVYMYLDQNGEKDREALFTGLATSPTSNYKDGVFDINLDCYSVLKVIEDIVLPRGWSVMAGENGVKKILELLAPLPCPIDYDSSLVMDTTSCLDQSIVAEANETNLSMIEKILSVINWKMQIGGDGTIYLSRWSDKSPIALLSQYENDVLETNFSINYDLFDCPNVLEVIYGDFTAIARDDDPDSMLSTVSRGREIWMVEDAQALEEYTSLGEYAYRRLKEEQSKTREISYSRRYLPGLYPDDIIRLDYDELKGDFYIDSQSITLGHAAVTSEQLTEVI